MQRQAILADADTVAQPGFDHVPADDALQTAERQNAEKFGAGSGFETSGPPKDDKRQRKCQADEPAEKPMAPFPPVDDLEVIKQHALVKNAVLGNLLVFLKRREPVGFAERWKRPKE